MSTVGRGEGVSHNDNKHDDNDKNDFRSVRADCKQDNLIATRARWQVQGRLGMGTIGGDNDEHSDANTNRTQHGAFSVQRYTTELSWRGFHRPALAPMCFFFVETSSRYDDKWF